MAGGILEALNYYLAEQPVIVGFRWSNSQTWGSTWSFLFASIILYLLAALAVHLLLFLVAHALLMFRGRRLILVGVLAALFGWRRSIRTSSCSPLISFLALLIPALHSQLMAVVSAAIFLGLLFSSAAEIRDTRWLWGRSKTPLQWLFCFPLGTRPTGRVFFWSYVFYLSRFLQLPRALFSPFMFQRRRRRSRRHRSNLELYYHLFHYPITIFISFLWLEFSQSFQVVAILCTTLLDSLLYGCRFWVQGAALLGNIYNVPAVTTSSTCCCFPTCIIINIYCRMVFLVCNLLCHLAVLLLHFSKGGCNGIRAWAFNSILHDASLLLFIKCYVNKLGLTGLPRGRDDDDSNHSATFGASTTATTAHVAHKHQ